MADWTPERVELSREHETQVWEAPKTVVEIPWWLRDPEKPPEKSPEMPEKQEPTGITKKEPLRPFGPRIMAPDQAPNTQDDRDMSDHDMFDDDVDTVPSVFSFSPFFEHGFQVDPELVFVDTPPPRMDPEDEFPRQITRYDVVVDADRLLEDTEEIIPLPRVTPALRLRAGKLGLLSLLVLALGTLVAATLRVLDLFPRLQP